MDPAGRYGAAIEEGVRHGDEDRPAGRIAVDHPFSGS
ncbi:hypothetical protein FHX45_005494 [Amycolatopsis granulosa]|nr:hypothetical protein [Amycolatopsis granulosa]